MNAIALFVLSGLLAKTLGLIRWTDAAGKTISLHGYLYGQWFAPLAAPKNASLLFALAHLAVMFGILSWMYRRRIFLKA
jgi:predicted acyltransferase